MKNKEEFKKYWRLLLSDSQFADKRNVLDNASKVQKQ